jgi:hypothetical protein
MAEYDLGTLIEETLKRNPHMSRRNLIKLGGICALAIADISLLAPTACTTIPAKDRASLRQIIIPSAKNIQRKGPDLKFSMQNPIGFGDYQRHRAVNSTGGIDFDIRDNAEIYPVASGIVNLVKEFPISGKTVAIYHGLYWSSYEHLEEQLVHSGQWVTRRDRIAIGGKTGSGAMRGGLHLHLAYVTTSDVAGLLNLVSDLEETYSNIILSNFDPVDFAAFKGVTDSHGNLTLPYWHGEDTDGPLDQLFNQHYDSKRKFFDNLLKEFPSDETKNLYNYKGTNFDTRHGIDRKIGAKVYFLYERIKTGKHSFSQADAQNILEQIKEFLSFGPLLTAQKRNPYMPQLYGL